MQTLPFVRNKTFLQVGVIILALIASVLTGITGFILASSFSPLIIGGLLAIGVISIVWLKRPVWALYCTLFVILLPDGLIPLNIQSILNRSLTMIALATWVLDILILRHKIRWTNATTFMLVFLIWCLASLLWTVDLSQATTQIQVYTLRFILFLILIPNLIRTPKELKGLMFILALSGWVVILATYSTVFVSGYTSGTRLKVLSANENGLGVLALLTMVGVLWFGLHPEERSMRIMKWMAAIYLLLTIGLVAMSGSRGSAISLFLILAAFLVFKPTRFWGKVGFSIIASGILIAPFIFSTTFERFSLVSGDTLLGGREVIWQATWMVIRDQPWFGVGIGNAPRAVLLYDSTLWGRTASETVSIHNPLLAIWAETGIPGLLVYLGILGSALGSFGIQYWKHWRHNMKNLLPYFPLVASIFLGYMASWIKGGGMESELTYYFMLALLLIPSGLITETTPTN